MNRTSELAKLLYRYIGLAIFCEVLELLNVFRPIPDMIALVSLLLAALHISEYANSVGRRKRR